MSLLYSLANSEITGSKLESNLELIDKVLSWELTGKVAEFIRSYSSYGNPPSELLNSVMRSRSEISVDSMLNNACRGLEENRMKCYIAETREDAGKIVREIVGSGKVVFKSFALTLEECGVGEHLVREGNEVYDTEYPLLLKELRGGDLSDYREKIERADFGITDVAALSVDPGALFLLPSSGLERLISMAPLKHIALVGLDQLAPSYEEGFRIVELAMLSKGYNYAGVVGGPSKTGDIEKKVVYGAHGPKEVHVIILDDGRREHMRGPFKDALSLPLLGKIPCPQLWPFWKKILGMDRSGELAKYLIDRRLTECLGIDITPLLKLL